MNPSPTVASPSKEERALNHIRRAILGGEFGPGYRLTVESIGSELDVSLATVREALKRLEGEGLVVYRRHAGATVIGLSMQQIADLLIVLGILEASATAMSAPHMTDADFAELDMLCDRFEAAIEDEDLAQVSQLNRDFHAKTFSKCPNESLLELITRTDQKSMIGRRSLFSAIPARPRKSAVEHRQLVELMRAGGRAQDIEDFVREHKRTTISVALGGVETN